MDSLLRCRPTLAASGAATASAPSTRLPHLQSQPSTALFSRHAFSTISALAISSVSPIFGFSARGTSIVALCTPSQSPLHDDTEENVVSARIPGLLELLSSAFPIWVALACAAALAKPQAFEWIRGGWQIFGLTITMLSMGMTLSFDDFGAAFAMPKELLAGVLLQYTVMPSAGAFLSHLFQLPPHYAAGLVLVACCPGGTASNVVTYLARGNVALSVIMTSVSTFLAVVMTPFLTAKLAGQYVAVDATALFMSTLQVVLLPVLAGVAMAHYFPKFVSRISSIAPLVAIITVAGLCASAIAQNAQAILSSGGQILLAVCSLHATGFFFGYLLSRLLGFHDSIARTISIEVGMQNSVLGVVLANQHFSNPLSTVPCAVSRRYESSA
ncbi:hypothetical protein GOP47_0024485 [Adiantum capillus-veneris]|uniref:Uncharacterized protein n=1 Tax=Adiantum capillus-veneris TaxID=13818 RepID=A0A9D4U286_ADICA|nr:hypothetical protein GOP47_0024485 [Adiantum capillus-veneris]